MDKNATRTGETSLVNWATCGACHASVGAGFAVHFSDGTKSVRCDTHIGTEFDRAAVRR